MVPGRGHAKSTSLSLDRSYGGQDEAREANMDIEKFTERARGSIQSAQGLALRSNHQVLKPEHILKVLIDDEEGLAARLIRAAGGRPDEAQKAVEVALARVPKVEGS